MRPTTAFDDNVFDITTLLHPGTVFDHPRDVVGHPSFAAAEKRAILSTTFLRSPRAPLFARRQAEITCDDRRDIRSLCELDGDKRNQSEGKPFRLRSAERAIAALKERHHGN
jgi:hypothetical protein